MKRFDSRRKHVSDDLRENQSTLHIENDLQCVSCLNPITAYPVKRNTSLAPLSAKCGQRILDNRRNAATSTFQ